MCDNWFPASQARTGSRKLKFESLTLIPRCHPWGLAVSSALKKGKNELEIEVVNLWPNRLIGDGQAPPEKRLTRTNVPHYYGLDPKTSLRPSGLLGPVRIITEK